MYFDKKNVIEMLAKANLINVSDSREYRQYILGKKGIFSIPDFYARFFDWAKEKDDKAIFDKASLCQKLMNENESYEKILEVIYKPMLRNDFSTLTEEYAKEILIRDLNSNWIRKFIEVSANKDEILHALICSSCFEITENGWRSTIMDEDTVIPTLVNDSNLHILIGHKNATKTFKNYLMIKYPHYSKYIRYIIAYMEKMNDFGIKGKTKVLEMCNYPKLYLSPEFDKEYLDDSLKGNILINGAGKIVKELAANLKCSKAEATNLLLDGKASLEDIISCNYEIYQIRNPNWQSYRWWNNKKNSTEWKKVRTTYLPAGKVIHWRWIDRVDEIRNHHIHNDKESPSVVMKRVFQEAEERQKEIYEEAEMLKAKPSFPECPLKGNEEFKQVETPYELYLVGKTFHNCAFTYEKALAQGESFIFTSSDICAEVCQDSEGKWRIQQCLGYKNSRPSKKIRARFDKWFKTAVSFKREEGRMKKEE